MKYFLRIISAIFILAISVSAPAFASINESWNSAEGLKRLQRSQFKNDFYQLVNFYQPQINPLYCSIATGVILLNATTEREKIPNQKENQIQKPKALGGGISEFHSYSQLSFLNEQTDKIKKREVINLQAAAGEKNNKEFFDAGTTLSEFSQILSEVYKFKVQKNYVEKNDEASRQKFRQDLKKYLADSKNFIVVNFDGKIVGNGARGHFSPVVAYDETSDSVFVLDVALHKTNWYWVDLAKLFQAMNSKDGDNYRGYLVVHN
ncbi:MAG: hypothetical protein EBS06_08505 [Proteobacteria bacterium]|nr:hypothetical protein [Pseudomonadota bacterium]